MQDIDKDFSKKVVKTWKWPLNRADYHVPDNIDPWFFYCRRHTREKEDLLPYHYEGQDLYVCRVCGAVYEFVPESERKGSDPLHFWRGLFKQPYDWDYIKTPTLLNYNFVHECEGFTTHPLLDAHCRGSRTDSLELIARFFTHNLMEGHINSPRFFYKDCKDIRVSEDDGMLIISSGQYPGVFPYNVFCVYREQPDSLSLEVSHSWSENVLGFTLDLNEEDYEDYVSYRLIKFTFLGYDESKLSERINELDERPAGKQQIPDDDKDLEITRRIIQDPFELNGFFLYEQKELTRLQ